MSASNPQELLQKQPFSAVVGLESVRCEHDIETLIGEGHECHVGNKQIKDCIGIQGSFCETTADQQPTQRDVTSQKTSPFRQVMTESAKRSELTGTTV
jgi:hypothetical protein